MCWHSGSGDCAWWALAREGGSRVGGLDAGVVGVQVGGRRVGEAAGLAGSLVICLKSSWMLRQGCGAWTGTYLLRNLRLRRVILPDPSTRTTYWSNWQTSMMMPVLSHLLEYGPVWF